MQEEIDGADTLMVRRYAQAVALGRTFEIKNPGLTRALGRLGHFTSILGDDKMNAIVSQTPDLAKRGSTKLTYQERQYVPTAVP